MRQVIRISLDRNQGNKMHRKQNMIWPIIMLLTLFMGELHGFFGSIYLDERALFWFTDIKQDIQWYIKDTAEGLTWIIFLSAWYCRERKRSHFWSNFILAFLIFRVIDLTLYWANHRHAGPLYLVSYLSIIVYGSIMYGKYRK